jgi:hypothetical protein
MRGTENDERGVLILAVEDLLSLGDLTKTFVSPNKRIVSPHSRETSKGR